MSDAAARAASQGRTVASAGHRFSGRPPAMNDDMGAPQSLLPAKSNGPASDGLETEIRVIRESGLFDEAYYRANNPKLAPSVDPVRHFLERGAGEGRQPNRMFDPAFYLGQNPDVAQSGDNPLVHFIHRGAAEGRRPHHDFDPAFYLARYPDVARAGQDPLLHYLSTGEREGRKPNAQEVGSAVAVTHAEIQCLKQPSFRDEVALFLAHSPHGHLKPHVRHYLDCLKRQGIAVILIVHADGPFIAIQQIDKISGIDGMFVRRNEGYDFAAWAHILRLHPELYDAKILYLLNDSVIGPTSDASFGSMLTRLRNSSAGLIGLTDNIVRDWHIQSYFLALKRPALSSIALRKFISDIVSYEDLEDVIDNFEVRLAPTLKGAGVECEVLFQLTEFRDDPTVYLWKHLLQTGFPFVKVKTLGGVPAGVDVSDWRELLAAQGYDVSLAERTLAEAKAPSPVPSAPLPGRSEERQSLRSKPALLIEPSRPDRITRISGAVRRRPIVLVLGMHRSGTSLCSHILSALGVDMADDIGVDVGNDRGHWERWEITEFHDRILGLFNRGYGDGFHDFALPVAWWAEPHVAQIRRQIVAFLEKRMGDGYFGFKDPRTVRLMPVWHQIVNELELVPKIVLCLRNPAQIARSLNARDGLDLEIGEYRWLVHTIDFFRYVNKFDFCTVEYEEWFNNPSANIEKLQKFLDLPWQQSKADLALALSGIIDPAARHDDSNDREPGQPLVRTLYKLARGVGQGGGARDQIAAIVSQFVSFQQLQRPFIKAFEDVAKTAAKYSEIERQATVLQATLSERDAAVAAAGARAVAAEGRLAAAVAEIEQQRGQIAELAKECDEASGLKATLAERETAVTELSGRAAELLAALQAAQAEAAAREAALRHAGQEAQEHGAAAVAMQAEVAALRDALAQAERAGRERAVAADAMQAEIGALREAVAQAEQAQASAAEAMQTEIAAARSALAQGEHEAQERAVAAEAVQAEVDTLREALAQAERAGQERAVAADVVQAEVDTLRDALAQAERAGQERAAAAEAMRVETVALRETLAGAEREAHERAAASEAMEAEVGALHEALAQAERTGQQRAATTAAVEAEVETLREALAQAEEAGQERAVAGEAMQAEVALLWDTLARDEREAEQSAVAGKATQRELAALRGALALADREAQERADRAQTSFAEVKVLREALAQAELASRQRAAAADAMQNEIAELRGALAQVEGLAQEHSAAAGTLKAEVGALRERLAQADEEAQERTFAIDAAAAEVAALREALAQADREAQERARAGAAIEAEVAELRERMVRAEAEATERAAAAAALRAEIDTLQGTLTAARHVGRAALAAFRVDTAAPPKPDAPAPRDWRRAIARFFGARRRV